MQAVLPCYFSAYHHPQYNCDKFSPEQHKSVFKWFADKLPEFIGTALANDSQSAQFSQPSGK